MPEYNGLFVLNKLGIIGTVKSHVFRTLFSYQGIVVGHTIQVYATQLNCEMEKSIE